MRFPLAGRNGLVVFTLLTLVGCGRTGLLDPAVVASAAGTGDAATGDAGTGDAVTGDTPTCPPSAGLLCGTGPRGRVVTSFASSFSPNDCFSVATTGEVWPTAAGDATGVAAYFCGDLAAVFGPSAATRPTGCGAVASLRTSTCRQTGGGSAGPPSLLDWYFQCILPDGSTCTTVLSFLDHGAGD
jgi:hypothetical protein